MAGLMAQIGTVTGIDGASPMAFVNAAVLILILILAYEVLMRFIALALGRHA